MGLAPYTLTRHTSPSLRIPYIRVRDSTGVRGGVVRDIRGRVGKELGQQGVRGPGMAGDAAAEERLWRGGELVEGCHR